MKRTLLTTICILIFISSLFLGTFGMLLFFAPIACIASVIVVTIKFSKSLEEKSLVRNIGFFSYSFVVYVLFSIADIVAHSNFNENLYDVKRLFLVQFICGIANAIVIFFTSDFFYFFPEFKHSNLNLKYSVALTACILLTSFCVLSSLWFIGD